MSSAVPHTASTTSAMRRSRSNWESGPVKLMAATTSPAALRTGAPTLAMPASKPATLSAKPRAHVPDLALQRFDGGRRFPGCGRERPVAEARAEGFEAMTGEQCPPHHRRVRRQSRTGPDVAHEPVRPGNPQQVDRGRPVEDCEMGGAAGAGAQSLKRCVGDLDELLGAQELEPEMEDPDPQPVGSRTREPGRGSEFGKGPLRARAVEQLEQPKAPGESGYHISGSIRPAHGAVRNSRTAELNVAGRST